LVNHEEPQAVIFDLGKVLLDFDYNRSAVCLAQACTAKRTSSVGVGVPNSTVDWMAYRGI
jgi:hypothetical protein